jgi:hypothetical protein
MQATTRLLRRGDEILLLIFRVTNDLVKRLIELSQCGYLKNCRFRKALR